MQTTGRRSAGRNGALEHPIQASGQGKGDVLTAVIQGVDKLATVRNTPDGHWTKIQDGAADAHQPTAKRM
jgi:hypothetical protein